tara:strand:+ start:459 stop:680 length:222 start_codon:yes stop_codon:yes gene_type:complete
MDEHANKQTKTIALLLGLSGGLFIVIGILAMIFPSLIVEYLGMSKTDAYILAGTLTFVGFIDLGYAKFLGSKR